MAGPSQVEFPGQKKNQRLRMRGTKQASADAQKRLRKQLKKLLDEPERVIPDFEWKGKLPWGRVDPVTKSLRDIRKVIEHRIDRRWLAKRMMSKRGCGIAKALAGSLVAALDDNIGMVATFKHPVYGNGTFVRKGDSKPAAMVGMQHVHNPRLRLLPWEEHAKKGWWFFSWKGGFTFTGNQPEVPDGWLEYWLSKSEFSCKIKGECHLIGELDADAVEASIESGGGYIRMQFNDGSIVGLRGDVFEEKGAKEGFIQSIALGMLPPKISAVIDAELVWRPEGWPEGKELPLVAVERVDEVLEAWLNLSVPEVKLWAMLKQAMLANLDSGFVVGNAWFPQQAIDDCLSAFSGGKEERAASRYIMERLGEEERGVAVDNEGEAEWLEEETVIRSRSTTLHNFLKATWAEFGLDLLHHFGVDEEAAEAAWQKQLEKPIPFNNFLRKMLAAKQESDRLARIPWNGVEFKGLCGQIQDLIIIAASEGLGKANSAAKKLRGDLDTSAVGWAWLVTQGKEGGNEWHFEQAARDKGGEWAHPLMELWKVAEVLLAGDLDDQTATAEAYVAAMEKFRKACGEQRELPSL